MPRQRLYHHYMVFVNSYATTEIKERVQKGEEYIINSAQISSLSYYSGGNERQAGIKFYQAVKIAMKSPLAYSVVVLRDSEIIARVKLEY